LKRLGYDLNSIAARVAEIYGMEPGDTLSKGQAAVKGADKKPFLLLGRQGVGNEKGSLDFGH
jgi:hypothetical protein